MAFMTDIHYLTQEGLEKIQKELDYLKTVKRPQIAERLANAIAQGDLSENADYEDAKDEQLHTDKRIVDLTQIIKNYELIDHRQSSGDTVDLGSTVKVKFNGKDHEYTIVGSEEADPGQGKISHESPLGKAFIGRKKNDKVEVKTPGGTISYKILEIL